MPMSNRAWRNGRGRRRAHPDRDAGARNWMDRLNRATTQEMNAALAFLNIIDPEAFDGWKQRNSKADDASVADLVTDPDLVAEVDAAVKQANLSVSNAESIRKFRILPVDFTEDTGELTPTMKVKRNVVAEKFASDIEAIYQKD